MEANYQAALDNVRSLRATLQDRRASYELAVKKLGDAVIRAPVAGADLRAAGAARRVHPREHPGRHDRADQPAQAAHQHPGKVRRRHSAGPGRRVRRSRRFRTGHFNGKVAYISPAVDQTTRTFAVEVLVENPERVLKPGFFAKGNVALKLDDNVVAVADDAVSTLAGVSSVYVIENGKMRQQIVTLGARQGKRWEIVDGLKGTETLAARSSISSPPARRSRPARKAAAAAKAGAAAGKARPTARRRPREPANDALRRQRPAPGLRPHDDRGAHRDRRLLVHRARPRPDAEDRRAGRHRQGQPARRQRRRGRNPDHQADRRGRSTPSAASTSCGPPPTRAMRASPSRSLLERDIESATQDVRDKIATIVGQFPRDTRPPEIQKIDPDAAPILTLALYGPRAQKEITEIADKQIKQVLETLAGVGSIGFNGERKREIQLLLNADRMNAYGLTVDQVRTAVERQNVEVPGGNFMSGPAEVALRTMGRIDDVDDFNRIILTYRDGSAITFADIGRVQDSVQEVRDATRLAVTACPARRWHPDGRKQSGSNTVEVVDRVMARLAQIQATLPPDLTINIGSDQSRVHPPLVRGHQAAPVPRRPARLLRRVPVHPQSARHAHRRAGRPDLDHRHLHLHEDVRLHAEQHDDARALARDRHRHRRRDRRAREHLPVRRGKRHHAQGGGGRGDERDRHGGDGDDPVAGRHLPAGGVHDRTGRPLLLQLRHHRGRRRFCSRCSSRSR